MKFEPKEYTNILEAIRMSSKDMENHISDYYMKFPSVRNQDVEWGINFPIFVASFYEFLRVKFYVPSQDEFVGFYLKYNKCYFEDNKHSEEIMEGLKARMCRAYPSIVRDLHFALMCRDAFVDANVIYSRKLDVQDGIDLMIGVRDVYYGVCLYTKTARAMSVRETKRGKRKNFENVTYVELPVDFVGSRKIGDFFLYGDCEMGELKGILLKIAENPVEVLNSDELMFEL